MNYYIYSLKYLTTSYYITLKPCIYWCSKIIFFSNFTYYILLHLTTN